MSDMEKLPAAFLAWCESAGIELDNDEDYLEWWDCWQAARREAMEQACAAMMRLFAGSGGLGALEALCVLDGTRDCDAALKKYPTQEAAVAELNRRRMEHEDFIKAARREQMEADCRIAASVVGGFTAAIRTDETEQELVRDPDGPWVLNSDVAAAIRAAFAATNREGA